jgi:hypothetical protein
MPRSRDGLGGLSRVSWSLGLGFVIALLFAGSAEAFGPLAQYGPAAPGASGHLEFPAGVAIGPDGNVYVSDDGNNRIAVYAPSGGFLRTFGDGQVQGPEGIAFDGAGNLFVASQENNRVVEFNGQGGMVRSFGGSGTGAGKLDSPEGVAVDQRGNVFVPEFFNARVSVFTTQGVFKRAFGWGVATGAAAPEVCTTSCLQGLAGGGAGQIGQPRQPAVDAAGNVYVADDSNFRIDVFTAQGAFKRAFGRNVGGAGVDVCTASCVIGASGSAAGQFSSPTAVRVGPTGDLFVSDGNNVNERVSVYSAQGVFRRAFGFDVIPGGATGFEICNLLTTCQAGTVGSAPGQLHTPFGATFDCRGALYVSDANNNRVQRFGEAGTGLPPCTSAGLPRPSNEFSFGKVHRNRKRGTARLTVIVPGPGELTLGSQSQPVSGAGTVSLLIKSKGKKRRRLNSRGRVTLRATVVYTPTNGDPNTQSRKIKLVKRLP